jgi:hypothetical protein
MRRLAPVLAAVLLALGIAQEVAAQSRPIGQILTPTPTRGLLGTPYPLAPGLPSLGQTPLPPPVPRTITMGPRPDIQATATAAAATITAADATATAVLGAPLTAVALTSTALAIPTRTPTPRIPTATPTRPASPTPLATPTLAPSPTPSPNVLALTRTVLTTAPIAVGEQTLEAGTPIEIPLDVALVNGAIPPGTTIRLPTGQVVTLPSGISVPAVETPTLLTSPLNATLAAPAQIGDTRLPAGTTITLPAGTAVLGSVEPNATVLLRTGTAVQVQGRAEMVGEPVPVVISPTPVALPPRLPTTGDADPVLWPAVVGLALLLTGWRLRRAA